MNVYKNLEAMTQVAIHQAKEHNCNYNVILMNPDENGEFSESNGSTYEMVADSFFNKERSNVKLIYKTDDLIQQEEKDCTDINDMILNNQFINPNNVFKIQNTYKDFINTESLYMNRNHTPHVREEAKIGNNDPCPCESGKKYKKCCK